MIIICDTDFLISSLIIHETTHHQAVKIGSLVANADMLFLDLVHFEIATVISRKYGYREARVILSKLEEINLSRISFRDHESAIWDEFRSHSKKNISFVDCANLVVAQKLKAKIASFDTFYPNTIRLLAK